MDGLALLCNLFADGPVTLGRLRAARIASLGELERAAPERLAGWLHSSVPQARAFGEEARRLLRRLAELAPPAPALPTRVAPERAQNDPRPAGRPRPAQRPFSADHAPVQAVPDARPSALPLRPGLFPGLDEQVCARLAQHHVRTAQALGESAGLALARRTGIPYASLLELARCARRTLAAPAPPLRAAPRDPTAGMTALSAGELVPFARRPRRAPAERELQRIDEFTQPVEPEAAGPFG